VLTLILHIPNEEPIACEVDELPSPQDTMLIVKNPRRRDGKDIHYLEPEVTTVIIPLSRVTIIEVMPTTDEEIIGFVRD